MKKKKKVIQIAPEYAALLEKYNIKFSNGVLVEPKPEKERPSIVRQKAQAINVPFRGANAVVVAPAQ